MALSHSVKTPRPTLTVPAALRRGIRANPPPWAQPTGVTPSAVISPSLPMQCFSATLGESGGIRFLSLRRISILRAGTAAAGLMCIPYLGIADPKPFVPVPPGEPCGVCIARCAVPAVCCSLLEFPDSQQHGAAGHRRSAAAAAKLSSRKQRRWIWGVSSAWSDASAVRGWGWVGLWDRLPEMHLHPWIQHCSRGADAWPHVLHGGCDGHTWPHPILLLPWSHSSSSHRCVNAQCFSLLEFPESQQQNLQTTGPHFEHNTSAAPQQLLQNFPKENSADGFGKLSVERRIGSVGLGFGLRSFSAPNPTFPTPRSVRSAPRSCAGCSSVTVFGIRVLAQLRAVLSIVQQRSERSARANNCQELKAVLRLCSRAGICASRVPTCAKAAKGVLEQRAVVAMPSCIGAVLCVRWQPWGCAPCGWSSGLCPVWGAIPAAVTAVGF